MQKPKPNTCNKYMMKCQKIGWKHPSTFPAVSKIPCGKSGAVSLGGKAGGGGYGGYCCTYLEK